MCVISSYKDNFVIEIQPREKRSERVLWISFWAEVGRCRLTLWNPS